MVEAIGEIRWRERVSPGRVRTLARQHGIGLLTATGWGSHAAKRWVFTAGDVPRLRNCFKTETRDGACVDCGRATYNNVRCEPCDNARLARWLTELQASKKRELDELKQANGLRDLKEAAGVLDRAPSYDAKLRREAAR